ncbi:MAG: alpha/beta hydrolase [Dehalococcoidia bacterium]
METARVRGAELEYEEAGSGEPVLLISAGPFADGFVPFLSEKALVERYRLISYHQRRPVPSANGPSPVTFAEHAADAADLLRQLGIGRAHVAGHSTGAAIALQLAVDCPDVVRSLALLEPPLLGAPGAAEFFEKAEPALAAYGSGDREGAMANFLSMACGLDWETCQKVIEEHMPGGVARAVNDADNFFGSYLPALSAWQFGAAQAAGISVPVLSVLGTETERLFVDSHAQLHSWFPQAEDCTIDGVAHLLHIQRPEPVARGVAEFFARHPMAGDMSGLAAGVPGKRSR